MKESPEKLLLSAAESAVLYGVSRTTFYELHAAGRKPMPIRLIGRCVRWRREEIEKHIAMSNGNLIPRDKWQHFMENKR